MSAYVVIKDGGNQETSGKMVTCDWRQDAISGTVTTCNMTSGKKRQVTGDNVTN